MWASYEANLEETETAQVNFLVSSPSPIWLKFRSALGAPGWLSVECVTLGVGSGHDLESWD